MIRHGQAPIPSGRSKRACVSCHASKIKCDGNSACSKCVKKGIACVYEQHDSAGDASAGSHVENSPDPTTTPPPVAASSLGLGQISPASELLLTERRIQWVLASRVEKSSPQPLVLDEEAPELADHVAKRYDELYFNHFHFRWPVLHRPSWEADGHTIAAGSVHMVGAWLEGTPNSKEFALSRHMSLMRQISTRLVCLLIKREKFVVDLFR
jgi:hypothetical protein